MTALAEKQRRTYDLCQAGFLLLYAHVSRQNRKPKALMSESRKILVSMMIQEQPYIQGKEGWALPRKDRPLLRRVPRSISMLGRHFNASFPVTIGLICCVRRTRAVCVKDSDLMGTKSMTCRRVWTADSACPHCCIDSNLKECPEVNFKAYPEVYGEE